MSKGFLGIIIVVIVVFAGIFFIGNHKTANAPGSKSSSSSKNTPTNHVEGKGKSGITVVEYGDYECPYCGQAYAPVKQAVADLNNQIYFQFRNFPLTQAHPNAFAGARAAEAAAMQGKFWQMHDLLYENQDPNGQSGWVASGDPLNQYFVGFAKQLGLNINQFKTDYNSSKVNDLINADMAEGNKLNITGTPTFFINGKKTDLQYADGAGAVEKVIQNAINQKNQGH
ncbi:MAG TPA: thioredoxin domain-containing protein [Candidatus Saccharimonadales bacterium]|nr:thioredoxin domain-containing protein [Candidatus Saccharimonadales bacterium]